jgi:hypothetical protein
MKLVAIARSRPLGRIAVLTAGLALVVPLALAATATAAPATAADSPSCPWLNQSLPVP